MATTAFGMATKASYLLDRKLQQRNLELTQQMPDGLPLPSPELAFLVTGSYDLTSWYESGVVGSNCIREVVSRVGRTMESFESILDFGCGCGRVIRQWAGLKSTRVHGTDYNALPIQWCREALPFAEFQTNELAPPLRYESNSFDFIYLISIFTHLTKELQDAWIMELSRVLRKNGLIYLTVHGETRKDGLIPSDRAAFDRGEMLIRHGRYAGANFCHVYHPDSYVRNVLVRDQLEVVDVVPGGARDANQDVYLLRKK
jgi:SAM-dependent methyltransferase